MKLTNELINIFINDTTNRIVTMLFATNKHFSTPIIVCKKYIRKILEEELTKISS